MTSQHRNQGFTFIEVLIYTILLAMIGAALTLFATRIIRQNAHAQITAQVLDNARGAMEEITREIRESNNVYTPTSVFDSSPGQLSLATAQNAPTGENESYVDFYVDDGRLYRKREDTAAELITSEQVQLTNMTFELLNEANARPAVRITLTVEPASGSTELIAQSSVTFTTTVAIR